ncbi:MAG: hypothetical protein II822_10135 [Prevotella sp.]|nr:hypothetical protein [Prevotella sp.]
MKQTIILGNIITMDEKRPFAKAALVKNGLFAYIGSAEEAKKLAGADAQVLDYGDNYIYPGFLESHCHGHLAGDRFIGQANLGQVGLTDYAKYREIIKEYIAKNPQREFYLASGWVENEEHVTKAYPIKSFYDAGANVVFHSDYPVSPMMNVKYSIYSIATSCTTTSRRSPRPISWPPSSMAKKSLRHKKKISRCEATNLRKNAYLCGV